MNLLIASDMQIVPDIVPEIRLTFGFSLPSAIIVARVQTYCTKYELCDNQLHRVSSLSCLCSVGFLYVSYCSMSTGLFATLDLLSYVISFFCLSPLFVFLCYYISFYHFGE